MTGTGSQRRGDTAAAHGTHEIDDDYHDFDTDDPRCSHCLGEPDLQECYDPIQFHPCTACQGTGLAEHQVIW